MRYQGLKDILDLAVRLQGAHGGLTLDDIEAEFSISRRTAERRRDAVDAAFGPLEPVDRDDGKRHWRLRSDALRRLVSVSAEELAELGAAAAALDRAGLGERAAMLRDLAVKLQTTLRAESQARMESDLEMLVQAEGLAMRPGPRQRLDRGLLALLREAITTCGWSSSATSPNRRGGGAGSRFGPSACSTGTARTWWGGPSGPRSHGCGVSRT